MTEFTELTEAEIFSLLSFDARHELGIKPNLSQIAEALAKFIPGEYFPYYKDLVNAALPDYGKNLVPAQLNLDKLKDINPTILQKLFNIPDSDLAYRAIANLDLKTQNLILENVSKTNRENINLLKSQNRLVSLEESTIALTEIAEPLRLYLARLGYLSS